LVVDDRLGPLRQAGFARLFAATLVSAIGDWASLVALGFGVLAFGTPTELGLILLAREIPIVALVLVGGVFADRLSRRRVIYASNLIRAIAQAGSALVLASGHPSSLLLAACAALNGAGSAFSRPAQAGFVRSLVPEAQLQPANALMSLSRNSVAIVGAAIGAVLVEAVSPAGALAVDAATFVGAAFLIASIPESGSRPSPVRSPLADLRVGWREFHSRTWVWVMVASFGAYQLSLFPITSVLGPDIAKRHLGGAASWAVILASGAVGALVGDLISLRVRARRPLVVSTLCGVPMAAYVVSLGLAAPVVVISIMSFVAWAAVGVTDSIWTTTLQRAVPDEIIARISSFDYLGSLALNPLGFALVGPLARATSISAVAIGAGVLLTVASLSVIAVPSIRGLRADGTDGSRAVAQ